MTDDDGARPSAVTTLDLFERGHDTRDLLVAGSAYGVDVSADVQHPH
jgi:hypothetical protein